MATGVPEQALTRFSSFLSLFLNEKREEKGEGKIMIKIWVVWFVCSNLGYQPYIYFPSAHSKISGDRGLFSYMPA